MVIPKTFKLFGQTYQVQQPYKIIVNGESLLGHCDSDNAIIKVRRNLKKEIKEVVFYHELTHAILFSLEYIRLSKDEKFVERFSRSLHQALTSMDNGRGKV